ncbi:PilX N-terminal domain-containing pilus assembly protein [Deinococcus knuensis]|uniref:DUF4900 domain-containing protein n=1 Tax=Deinococcus knuensis TaxID=1837380 RepID=A0ABQ2SR37_9DEIO|nr:PilX N-terminal domain-containing pilus assembly protein [Deinococcus knuensis]GGS35101.1 hypothetical protein GCM10008961_28570 [Deinococcus knuensis]
MTPPTHRRQEGATLIVTVLTMTVLIAVLLAVSTQLTLSSRSSSVDRRDALQAQYAAESGLAATTTYLRDIQSVFNGIRNADGTRTPILVVPKTLKASELLTLAENYCGKPSATAWTQTTAASVYPVKYRCDATPSNTLDNAARYEVLARFANINLLPATLVATKTGGIKSTSDLQAYWKDVFSPNGVTTKPPGSTYTVNYSLKPVRVEREGNTNFKFYLQVNSVQSNGSTGKAERVILANATKQSEIWFQITLPTFVDRVLFTNQHKTRSGTRPNFTDQTFDGPVHTNDRFTFANGATANFKSKVTSAGCYAFQSDGSCATRSDGSPQQNPGLYVGSTLTTLNNPLGGLGGTLVNTLGQLTTAVPGGVNFGTSPDWQAEYQPMPENAEDQQGAANAGGLTIPDGATVTMAASTSGNSVVSPTSYSATNKKWSPDATYQFITVVSGTTTTIYRLNSSGKLEKKTGTSGWSTERSSFNGVLYSPGSINVAGPGRDSSNQSLPALAPFAQMTVAAEKDVGIVNDLSYSDIPCKGAESCASKATPANLLGIYSQTGDVSILNSAPDNVNVHAVLMASQGEVTVQDYNKGEYKRVCTRYCGTYYAQYANVQVPAGRGNVNLVGGLIENYYGAFGTFNPSDPTTSMTGYGRNFSFDERMGEGFGMTPPYFPVSPKWKIENPSSDGVALSNLVWQQGKK